MAGLDLDVQKGAKSGRIVDHLIQEKTESAGSVGAAIGARSDFEAMPDGRAAMPIPARIGRQRSETVMAIVFVACIVVIVLLYCAHLVVAGVGQVSALHPILGGTYLIAWAMAATILIAFAIRVFVEYRSLRNITGLQSMARMAGRQEPLSHHAGRQAILDYLDELEARGDSQTKQGIVQLRTKFGQYAGDVVRDFCLLNDLVLNLVDRQVDARLTESALHVAIATALASRVFDPLIVATYAIKTVRQTAAAYRGRPGLFGTVQLVARAMSAAVLAEVADVIADALSQLAGIKVAAKLSARLGEGLSNGFVMLRLGDATKRLCRPVPPLRANYAQSLTQLVSALLSQSQSPAAEVTNDSHAT
jgi:putative membrane protein